MIDIVIGFAYDRKPVHTKRNVESIEAEYEDERTICRIRSMLQSYGAVKDIIWGPDIVSRMAEINVDVIFNITEAAGGRNRESLLPSLAESRGIPFTGSDALALGISLDKYLTKVISGHVGIPTPDFTLLKEPGELDKLSNKISNLNFPLILKPNTGGSSMGIRKNSKVENMKELTLLAGWLFKNYRESILVEEFIPGREFTVGLIEWSKLEVFPAAEIRFDDNDSNNFYSYEMKSIHNKEVICPADIAAYSRKLMEEYSKRIFNTLGCRGLARVDFRMKPDGRIYLLEINPLPGLSPFYGIYPILAEKAGISLRKLVGILIDNTLKQSYKGMM